MIPLFHDFSESTVLVVGGGSVGARKARRFAREARTVVVSPEFTDASFGDAELVRAAPDREAIEDWLERVEPALVVAATDDEELNGAVADAARDRGILVNRADRAGRDRGEGSVVVPATVREDPVIVAIATGGAAPALSKDLRRELEEEIEGAGAMAEFLGEFRTELKARGVAPDRRRELVGDAVASPAVWTGLRTGAPNDRQVIEDVLDRLEGGGESG
ncbi:bifunctional precorrin-2 dehydrogenase/sirohydrochlorin ferrochelatase [Saliphagus sp. LR7]|uniref:precorrin-2 dehydrogenase/sirohydrochlorin ferrochelatase family protein n=1 Tax=Saliphagus sp. LR7 TaxID=2282654 RepID=UPI000DF7F4CF|nr:NAD(P)-dependent oxidoreductase [Saliphagus sp. LR7]